MKRKLLYLLSVAFLASCSAPKYSYNFDHYNYNAGKKKSIATETQIAAEQSPLAIQPNELVASTSSAPILREEKVSAPTAEVKTETKSYEQLTKVEQKELKKNLKKFVKENKESIKASKAMDHDLKLAAIFGAVGLVLTLFGGISSAFWIIGVIAIVIGVVFLVKWLVRQ
jgi:hypothetical protein